MSETPHTHPFAEPERQPEPKTWDILRITIITPDGTVFIRQVDIKSLISALTLTIRDIQAENHIILPYPLKITVQQFSTTHPETVPFDPLNPES